MPTATASPTEPSHCLRPMPGDSSSCRTWLCRFSGTSVLPPHINQRAVLLGIWLLPFQAHRQWVCFASMSRPSGDLAYEVT